MRKLTSIGILLLSLYGAMAVAGEGSTTTPAKAPATEPNVTALKLLAQQDTLPKGHLPEPKPLLLFATGFLGLAIGVHIRRKF